MTYQFIKSSTQMEEELNRLWDDYPLYKFVCDAQWVRKKELAICECVPDKDGQRELFIELVRFDWIIQDETKNKRKSPKR